MSHSLSSEPLPKPKIELPNLDFQQFFCSKQLLHEERYLNRNCFVAFGENQFNLFLWDTHFRKLKLGFHQFFCSKWLIRSKKYVKRCLYVEFKENRLSHFWDIHFWSLYPTSGFFIFTKTWKYCLYNYLVLRIKFGVSIFIYFGDIKR